MKKIKKQIIAIFVFIVAIIITLSMQNNKVSSLPNNSERTLQDFENGNLCRWGESVRYISLMADDVLNCNNIYCVEKGQYVSSGKKEWVIRSKAVIKGDDVEFYMLFKNDGWKSYGKGTSGSHNNKLAAILCEGELGRYKIIPNNSNKNANATNSQESLWAYWNTWVEKSGAATVRMGSGGANDGDYDCIYDTYMNSYNYNVTVYFLEASISGYQNLILVERDTPTQREESKTKVTVTKKWNDNGNTSARPSEITVRLKAGNSRAKYADGSTVPDAKLNASNEWKYTFTELPESNSNGNKIDYTVEEIGDISGYEKGKAVETSDKNFTITNTLLTNITVNKKWDDYQNLDDLRTSSITVTLYSGGVSTEKTVTLNESNNWTASFDGLRKYNANGSEIKYTVKETKVANYDSPTYSNSSDSQGNTVITITNKHTPKYDGYIEISGKVWVDGRGGKGNNINGTLGNEDSLLEGVKVRLKDASGNLISSTYTDKDGEFNRTDYAITAADGTYTIRVNYDNSENVYKLYENAQTIKNKLQTAYVEFEYDALKYTTVKVSTTGANTSKATENETTRKQFDNNHYKVTADTQTPDIWTDRQITAVTGKLSIYAKGETEKNRLEVIKYCNGNGTYDRTQYDDASKVKKGLKHNCENCENKGHTKEIWKYGVDVEKIPNINLGLFEREQPDVAVFSDINNVQVQMNNQEYTYYYNSRGNQYDSNSDDYIKTKFQNKGTYTYRRPVNPADIAYVNNVNGDAMKVFITYEIQLANQASTLKSTIHSITNCYDTDYEIVSITKDDKNLNYTDSNYYETTRTGKTKEITIENLDVELEPETESSKIKIKFEISKDKIKGLLNDEAPLNNATEIRAYSTRYGKETLYAEQRKGGRNDNPYAGYDEDSQPGNAGFYINAEQRIEAEKLEDDTDIAPAFVLCKEKGVKILSGNVWEDTDIDNGSGSNNYRLGDGKKSANEKNVGNVRVELYKINDDGSTTLATLYKVNSDTGEISTKPAITYSSNDDANKGYYSFGSEEGYSVVTDQYLIKYIYGSNEDILENDATTINNVKISARDYKSTIISSETELYNLFKGTSTNKKWHLSLDKGYSIAVDNMEQRVKIEDLQYSNFNDGISISAEGKPFEMQLEFTANNEATVKEDGKELQNGNGSLKNELDVFDFGIIERAREDLYVQKTATNIKVTLSNGQILLEGDPRREDTNINYTKTTGFRQQNLNSEQAKNALDKLLLIEMDTELIQGSKLEVKYEIKVVNDSEKDIDYYIGGYDSNQGFDSSKLRTEYYYFGTNNENSPIVTSSINSVVDYISSEMEYIWEEPSKWTKVTSSELGQEDNKLVNDKTLRLLDNGKYIAYLTEQYCELAPGEDCVLQYATARKTLSNKDDNVYGNHIEILQIDAKTARTIEGKNEETGTPEPKESKPGNYVPGTDTRKTDTDIEKEEAGKHEQDDDRVNVIITPPTGITNYIIKYVITILVGLILVAVTIIIIKKKILTK